VVELCVGRVSNQEVSSEAISFLGIQSTYDPLWPRLTSLRLTNGLGWDAVASTLVFLSSRITRLTLILPRDNNILLRPILSVASDRCHQLQELVLDIVAGDSHSISGVGGLISTCRDTLRTLHIISPTKTEYIPIIANLTHLRSLTLQTAHFPRILPLNAFPSLEEVTILHFHGQPLQYFFECLGTSGLKVVRVTGANTALTTFKNSIAALLRFSASLRVLAISAVMNIDLPGVVVPSLFTNLRTLKVGCSAWKDGTHAPGAFRPTDQAIAELGVAMPNITHLTLGSQACRHLHCVTFLSLVSLSTTCQDLEYLAIKVDLQTMVTPSLREGEDIEPGATFDTTQGGACKLRTLAVGFSTLPDHPEAGWIVAIGLGKIFPSLSKVVGYGPNLLKWEPVERNIRMSRRVLRTVQS
jgi:hypothetical protein